MGLFLFPSPAPGMRRKRGLLAKIAILTGLFMPGVPHAAETWNPPYPRVTCLWGGYETARGPEFYAGYDLFIAYNDFILTPTVNSQMRQLNPDLRILLSSNLTYGDPWMTEWEGAQPGDPEYMYLFRNTQGEILQVAYWDHPMFNMCNPDCVEAVLDRVVGDYLGARQPYDGLFFDRIHDTITWLGDDIDIDQDGYPESPHVIDDLYEQGVTDFLVNLRSRLEDIIICGNDAPLVYTPYVNGREYEYQLQIVMDWGGWIDWPWLANEYLRMTRECVPPPATFLCSNPPRSHRDKYNLDVRWGMPAEMQETCGRYFGRMRLGITTALLGNGLTCYEYGDTWHGNPWWFDEYDNAGTEKGYLGYPITDNYETAATPASSPTPIHTPEAWEPHGVQRRDFENGVVLCNSTRHWQVVDLGWEFTRIDGAQAPREMFTIDDSQSGEVNFVATDGFLEKEATYDEWLTSIREAPAGAGTESATWSFQTRYGGEFEFWTWRAPNPVRTSSARYLIPNASGIGEMRVDFSQGEPSWVPLGTYSLDTGWNHVVLTNEAPSGLVVADAVKVESIHRYNDGERVTRVDLPPFDGVILLGAPPTWTPTPTVTPTYTPQLAEILNPGFEYGHHHPWQRTTVLGVATGAQFTVVQHEGYYMFGYGAQNEAPDFERLSQNVPTIPGEWYEFRYWAYTDSIGGQATDTRIRCYLDPSGTRTFDETTAGPWASTGGDWQEFRRYVQAEAEWITVAMHMEHRASMERALLYVDDTSLVPVSPQPTYSFTPTPTQTLTFTSTGTATPTETPTLTSSATRTPFADWDKDGIPDGLEGDVAPGPDRTNRFLADSDGDALQDGDEDANRNGHYEPGSETNPRAVDTDQDRYEDGIEVLLLAANPLSASSPGEFFVDQDNDRLPDSLDPIPDTPDTDGDRFLDGYEAAVMGMPAVQNARLHPKLGDTVANDIWDNGDSQMIMNFFARNEVFNFFSSRSDLNRDGVIDNADSQISINYFGRVQPYLPAR